jgi:hypothetical protein
VFYVSRKYCETWFEHDAKPASDYLIFSCVLSSTLTSSYFWGNADKTSATIVTASSTGLTFSYLAWLRIKSCQKAVKTDLHTPLLVEETLLDDPLPSPAAAFSNMLGAVDTDSASTSAHCTPKSFADMMARIENAADESGTAQLVCNDSSHTCHVGQSVQIDVYMHVCICAHFCLHLRCSHLCVQHLLCEVCPCKHVCTGDQLWQQ